MSIINQAFWFNQSQSFIRSICLVNSPPYISCRFHSFHSSIMSSISFMSSISCWFHYFHLIICCFIHIIQAQTVGFLRKYIYHSFIQVVDFIVKYLTFVSGLLSPILYCAKNSKFKEAASLLTQSLRAKLRTGGNRSTSKQTPTVLEFNNLLHRKTSDTDSPLPLKKD